jgi:hypothetical protein
VAAALISHRRAENMADKVARTGKFMIDGLHKLKCK